MQFTNPASICSIWGSMSIYPENLSELVDMFPSEEACLEYLSMIRWPDGYVCIRCAGKNIWKMSSGLYRCQTCRYAGSVISGTLFQDTHKPLRLWFQAMWYAVGQKNGVSALGLQKALGLGSSTQHGNGYTNCAERWLDLVAIN